MLCPALVTAIARHANHPQWNNIRMGREIQKHLALNLHEKAVVPLAPCGLEEIKKFQTVLPQYQIHVLSKEGTFQWYCVPRPRQCYFYLFI